MSSTDYQHKTPCTERIPGTLELCNVLVPIHWRGSTPIRQEHECRAAHRFEGDDVMPSDSELAEKVQDVEPPTVKRATLFDGVLDSFRTETELNGFKVKQGALL